MKYLALLRGINVGGKSIVKMSDLKTLFENLGYKNVSTYINSGNVIFETTKEINSTEITKTIELALKKNFKWDLKIVLLSEKELKNILGKVPREWKYPNDLRTYVAFIRKPVTADDVLGEIKPKENIDFVEKGPGVLYLSTKLSGITKSGFTKLVTKSIYKEITIRNYKTVLKLLKLIN